MEKLKEQLKRKIDKLPNNKLNRVSELLESMELGKKKKNILSYTGSWNDIDEDIFQEFIHIENRRKNKRPRFFE